MRQKVYLEYQIHQQQDNNYVCFKDQEIDLYDYFNDEHKTYFYNDIDKIKLSICTRAFSNEIKDNIIERVEYFSTGLVTHFFIDVDIEINNIVYKYESMSLDHMHAISDILSTKNNVEDLLGLLNIFQSQDDENHIYKILLSKIKTWEKEYHIDNPRNIEISEQVNTISQNVKQEQVKYKDVIGPLRLLSIKKTIIMLVVVAAFALLWFIFK